MHIIPNELINIIFDELFIEHDKYYKSNFINILSLNKNFNELIKIFVNHTLEHPFDVDDLPTIFINQNYIITKDLTILNKYNNIIKLNISRCGLFNYKIPY